MRLQLPSGLPSIFRFDFVSTLHHGAELSK
jgi:hypothetical protein